MDEDCMIENKFLHESFDFKNMTWTIYNVFTLPQTEGYKVTTPPFPFANATWELRLYPNGDALAETDLRRQNCIELEIRRLNSRIPKQEVFYKFSVLKKNGEEFNSYSNLTLFTPKENAWVVQRYLKRWQLMDMMRTFTTPLDLTITCQMRIKKEEGMYTSHIESAIFLSNNKTFTDFKRLFLEKENSDVLIRVKGREFPSHRAILSARSPVFASVFRNDMIEKATGIVDIDDCDPSPFSDFLCFLYCGQAENLSTENVFSLFTVADKYDVQDLRSLCKNFIQNNLSIGSFCKIVTLALQHSENELIESSIRFLARNLEEIIKSTEWQSLLLDNPIQCNELLIRAVAFKK